MKTDLSKLKEENLITRFVSHGVPVEIYIDDSEYTEEDMMFCLFGDGCKKICRRKISDYELRILNYEVGWQDFRNTEECKLNEVD